MSISTTIDKPTRLEVVRERQQADGRVLVYGYDGDDWRPALILWLTPDNAANWIASLKALAEEAKP